MKKSVPTKVCVQFMAERWFVFTAKVISVLAEETILFQISFCYILIFKKVGFPFSSPPLHTKAFRCCLTVRIKFNLHCRESRKSPMNGHFLKEALWIHHMVWWKVKYDEETHLLVQFQKDFVQMRRSICSLFLYSIGFGWPIRLLAWVRELLINSKSHWSVWQL